MNVVKDSQKFRPEMDFQNGAIQALLGPVTCSFRCGGMTSSGAVLKMTGGCLLLRIRWRLQYYRRAAAMWVHPQLFLGAKSGAVLVL